MVTTLRRSFALLLTLALLLCALPLSASAASTLYASYHDQDITDKEFVICSNAPSITLEEIEEAIAVNTKLFYSGFDFCETDKGDRDYVDSQDWAKYTLRDGEYIYLALYETKSDYINGSNQVFIKLSYSTDEFRFSVKPESSYTLSLDEFDPSGSYNLYKYRKTAVLYIDRLPVGGHLFLDNAAVKAGDEIELSKIHSGLLIYIAPSSSSKLDKDSFRFSVYSGSSPMIKDADMNITLTSINPSGLPVNSDIEIELDSTGTLVFKTKDFDYQGYTYDIDDFDYIRINQLPAYGYIKYNDTLILTSTWIKLSDVEDGKLSYTLDLDTDYSSVTSDALTYTVYTDSKNSAYTGITTLDISRFSAAGYDYVVRTDARGCRTFRLADFDDPNGAYEAADYTSTSARNDGYIMLRSMPSYGKLTLDGKDLSAGDLVYLDEIRQGMLKYVPNSASDSTPDSMEFLLYSAENSRSALTRDVIFIDRTAVKTGVATFYGEDALVAWMNGETSYVFTLDDLSDPEGSAPLEDYHNADNDGWVEILSLPEDGKLALKSGSRSVQVAVGDEIPLDDIANGLLSFTRDKSATESYTRFTFCAYTNRGRVISSDKVTLYIDFYESNPYAKGSYTYTLNKGSKTLRVEFTDLTVSNDSITTGLTAADITDLVAEADFAGGTLELIADVKDHSLDSRTISIDASLFTDDAKKATFSTIRLISNDAGTNTSGSSITNTCKLSIPVNTVSSLYVMSSADFSITMEKYSMTTADKADLPNKSFNGGLARRATFYVGNTKVNVTGAAMTLPYGKITVKPSTVIMMRQTDSGKFEPALSSTYNSADYTVTALCESGLVCTPYYRGNDTGMSFSDLSAANVSWATEYVYSLAARNVVQGVGNGLFSPSKSVTKAEFLKMLVGSLGLYDANATCSFNDIKGTNADWAYSYIASAVKAGIVTDGTSFQPSAAIDRQTMALYAYRATLSAAANIELPTTYTAEKFLDQSGILSGNTTAVTAMQRAGIIQGDGAGHFNPNGTTTRAAASKIICMLMQFKYQQ